MFDLVASCLKFSHSYFKFLNTHEQCYYINNTNNELSQECQKTEK